MKILNLGKTELPMDVIQDYLDSIRPIYTIGVSQLSLVRFSIFILSNPDRFMVDSACAPSCTFAISENGG